MAPRYIERVKSQSDTLQKLYGMPLFDPPPYNRSLHRRSTSSSTENSASKPRSEDSRSSSSTCLTSFAYSSSFDLPTYQQAIQQFAQGETPSIPRGLSSSSDLPTYQQAIQQFAQGEPPSIPRGSRVLVTGASSWHGMHTVDQLLRQGYIVRGAVTDANKALETTSYFHERYSSDRFEAVIVPDTTVPGAYNVAARRCSGLVHADNMKKTSANPYDVISPTIMGALNMLEAAAREPCMRRVVYCSSVLAATNHGGDAPSTITRESWNIAAFLNAWNPSLSRNNRLKEMMASAAMQAEQTVWKWYHDKRPGFVLNCVLPDLLCGDFLLPCHAETELSGQILASIRRADLAPLSDCPPRHFADVQDLALIHVAALILPGVMNERLFVIAQPWDLNIVIQTATATDRGTNLVNQELDRTHYKEATGAEALLMRMRKPGWTTLEASVQRASEHFTKVKE